MSLRQYASLMLAGTALCWVVWIFVVGFLDPASAGWLGFGLFYAALFLALVGSFALLGLMIRGLLLQRESVLQHVAISFRQAFSFAFVVIAALFLQSKDILTWWNMGFLVLAVTLVEFAVLAIKRQPTSL